MKLGNIALNTPNDFKQAAKSIREQAGIDHNGDRAFFTFGPTVFKCDNRNEAILNLADKIEKGIPSSIKRSPIKKHKVSMARGAFLPQFQDKENLDTYCALFGKTA